MRLHQPTARYAVIAMAILVTGFVMRNQEDAAAQVAPLKLVSTAWPPFTDDTGKTRLALDLVETALGRMGMRSQTTIVEPAQFTKALLSSAFDGSAAAWRDAERDNALVFSQPYLENRLILVGRAGADVSATTLAALKGKRIAIVEGYAYGDAVDAAGPTYIRSRGEDDSVSLVLGEKADYALMDALVVEYLVNAHPTEAKTRLNIGTTPLVVRPLHFAITKTRPDSVTIIARFNGQLRNMILDRTYHKLLRVPWIRADVDGDGVSELIPYSDQTGTTAPSHAYSIVSTDPQKAKAPDASRIYVGGSIYSDWATVPNRYKVPDSQWPDPSRSTASIFTFRF
jgi:polar amino acid transport system substrate-binding protein